MVFNILIKKKKKKKERELNFIVTITLENI